MNKEEILVTTSDNTLQLNTFINIRNNPSAISSQCYQSGPLILTIV